MTISMRTKLKNLKCSDLEAAQLAEKQREEHIEHIEHIEKFKLKVLDEDINKGNNRK